jgi:RNA polymerase sigma-70 factor (ECF subfamily)
MRRDADERDMTVASENLLATWFEQHRAFLWGLSYRITGSAADADDVVQDTFVRACKHAPDHLDDPRRWLMRIAINLGRDVLRRRKRRAYVGPWLPTPIETDDGDSPPSFEPVVEGQTLEGRYDLIESVSLAFLQALEVLTPTQRAVLLLRDAFDYSAAEVGAVIDTTEGNVRIIHLRARRAIDAYDSRRAATTSANRARTNDVLRQFVDLLAAGDVHALEQMLAADVRAVTDGGGEFTASPIPIVGAFRVARFFSRLAASRTGGVHVDIRAINGQATAVFDFPQARGRRAPRLLLSADVDSTGAIANIWVIASSAKLARIPALGPKS